MLFDNERYGPFFYAHITVSHPFCCATENRLKAEFAAMTATHIQKVTAQTYKKYKSSVK